MLNFEFSSEQKMLRDLAHDFAEKEIKPVAEHYDVTEEYPWPVIKKAQEYGLFSVNIPEAYGGPGMSLLEEVILTEELAWGCSGVETAEEPRIPMLKIGREFQRGMNCLAGHLAYRLIPGVVDKIQRGEVFRAEP